MSVIPCTHRRNVVAGTTANGVMIEIFGCEIETVCTLADFGLSKGGEPLTICDRCDRRDEPLRPVEAVGDALKDVLAECWITVPGCGECETWRLKMNAWGIAGCQSHRQEILAHLASKSDEVKGSIIGWLRMGMARLKGFKSVEDLLDAAIDRAKRA